MSTREDDMPPNCKSPAEVFDTQEEIQAVADWVESIVDHDYCRHLKKEGFGGCELWFPSSGGKLDFFDIDVGKHRCENMADYLKFHNSHVNRQAIVDQCLASSPKLMDVKVPDIISHRFSRSEFYEIKPDSASGRKKGKDKIGWFMLLCKPDKANLPYKAGTSYKPNFVVDLPGGNALGGKYKIVVHIEWEVDGLILYRLCLVSTRPRQDDGCTALLRAGALAAVVRIRLSEQDTQTVLDGLLAAAESPQQHAVGRASGAGAAPNLRDDVMYVQLLLNDWHGRQGTALIAEDGLFGPQTDGAIISFQQSVTGIPDGRVDVGGPAITALERGHLRAAFAPGMLNPDQLPTLTLHGDTIYPDWTGEGNPDDLADEISWQMLLNAMEREVRGYFGLLYHPQVPVGGAGPTDVIGTPTLGLGSQGEAVRKLQQLLNEHVPDLPSLAVDGDFGPVTDERVRVYQRRVEITDDGIAGPQTWGMLTGGERSQEAAAGTPTLQQGAHGPAVRKLQRLLNDHLPDMQLVVDGQFGPVTHARVREFQQRVAIAVDGIVGPQTWGHLTQ
ncbi:peptidoglycan-binding protein [Streptomyces litmocidini]|uniref:peptidoglycan-binding domain-containing protein n=1 Tax=Streptomyces litmocidini TaxID=67318 RepID=UPI0033D1EC01